jgi:Uma2 family endonuclease
MTLAQPKKRYTPAEYYAFERDAQYKSDFYDGEIFAMAGGTGAHSDITSNIIIALGSRLTHGPCRVRESNQRVKVQATGLRAYPDVAVYCGSVEYDQEDPDQQTATNPTILVEVLSPSTEAYDRGFKAENYRRIEALKAYVIVAQDRPHAEVYHRQTNGSWSISDVSGLAATIGLDVIGVQIPMVEVYNRVEFPPTAPSQTPGVSP